MRTQRALVDTDAAAPGVPRYMTIAGRCYALPGVSSVLHCEALDVVTDVSCGRLLALGGEPQPLLFPVWQFPHGRRLPHLADVLAALAATRTDPLTLAMWFTRARSELGGACAAGWLQRGDPQVVLALTTRLRRHPGGAPPSERSPLIRTA